MSDLKQPPMDGSAGPLARCCEGSNKNKLYSIADPCTEPNMTLVTGNGECKCVECTGTASEPNGSCQKLGYGSCYVCEDGKCVKGPLCCSNVPGKKSAGCYKTPAEIEDDVDCCVNEYIYVEFTASAVTQVNGTYKSDTKTRDCNSTRGETRRFYTTRVDCETFTVESESLEGEINSKNVTCGCPKGKYTYSRERLWKTSPSGTKVPARGICSTTYAYQGLVKLGGETNGQDFGGDCWWAWSCAGSYARWIVGTTGSGGNDTVSCIKNRGAFSPAAEHPSCTGVLEYNDSLPAGAKLANLNPGNNRCACTGPAYASMELNNNWNGYCGICSGNAHWEQASNGCYIVQNSA